MSKSQALEMYLAMASKKAGFRLVSLMSIKKKKQSINESCDSV